MANISNLPVRVPDEIRELSVELHDYLQNQANTLRLESTEIRTGQTVLPLIFLTEVTDLNLYALGATAQFQHTTLGFLTARYVQFSDMVTGGGPCGFLSGAETTQLKITNQFSKSNASLVAGILPSLAVPKNDQFGWVLIQGVNLFPIDIRAGDIGVESSEVYWSGTNELAVDAVGLVVGQQLNPVAVSDSFPTGSIKIAISSSTGQAGQAVINTRIDGLESTVNDNAASIVTLTQTIATEDEALALSIVTLSATVGANTAGIVESNRSRASADDALAIRIETVGASISPAIVAQVQVETLARTNADEALTSQVTNLDTKFGSLTADLSNSQANLITSVAAQSSQSNALVEQTAELNASLSRRAEGAKENLLDDPAAGAESSSTGTIIKVVDLLIADAGIPVGDSVSLSGFQLSDDIERMGLRISFLDGADALISDSGILAQTETDVYAYGIVEGIVIPVGTVKIRCEAVRVTAAATSISAKQFMLVAGESASRYPYTTANARATTVLSARVTVTEGDIFTNAQSITTLEVTVDDPVSGVVANASAIVDVSAEIVVIDGELVTLNAQYSVKLNVNGRVAGFGLAATANEAGNVDTSAIFEVDTFQIHDGTTGDAPFQISGGQVKIGANRLADGTAFTGTHGIGTSATIVLDGNPGQESIFLELAGIKLFEVTTAGTTLRDATNGILLDTSGGANSANSSVWNSILAATDSANGSVTAAADGLQLRAVQQGSTQGADLNRDVTGQIDSSNSSALLEAGVIGEVFIADLAVTNAKIAGVIQSANFNDTTKVGWKLDKDGSIQGNSIQIFGPTANLLFGVGGNLDGLVRFADSRSLTHGMQSGIVKDGDSIVFTRDFAEPPLVFFGAGGLSFSGSLTGDHSQAFIAKSITVSGFDAELLLKENASAVVLETDDESGGGGVVGATQEFEIQKDIATEAFDDQYTYFATVRITNIPTGGGDFDPGNAVVGLYSNNGGGWILQSTVNLSSAGFAEPGITSDIIFSKVITVDALTNTGTSPRTFGISVESFLVGAEIIAFEKVTYEIATGVPNSTTATPAGAAGVYWMAVAGQEG